MRHFLALGAVLISISGCGGESGTGSGQFNVNGSGGSTGGSTTAGGATSAGGSTTAGGPSGGGVTGSAGAAGGACTGPVNCPLIKPCPAGEEPITPPGTCCPTSCSPVGAGGAGSGGATGSGGVSGGGGACTGPVNCPLIKPCPAGEEPIIPPGTCCPTSCGPMGAGGATGVECKNAGDCPVPDICRLCSDGSSSCAEGECVKGKCETTFPACPPDAGTAPGCKTAAECAVPQLCKACPNGGASCAKAECVNGMCETTFPACAGGTGGVSGAGGVTGSGGSGGGSCMTSSDCAKGDQCGFPIADGCSAKGTCFPRPEVICNAIELGCACDGSAVNIACNGLPGGYAPKPLLKSGSCN